MSNLRRAGALAGLLIAAGSLAPLPGAAQSAAELAVADSSPFRPLLLPSPSAVRTASGRPGPSYWQQKVDYTIAAALDPVRNRISGTETIRYKNNSPDSLPYLWMFLEQNLCAPTSITNVLNQPPLEFLGSEFDFSCQGFAGGLTLDYLRVAGHTVAHVVYGTTMRVDLAAPLAPGASVDLEAKWSFDVPEQGGGRMGHDGALYEVAQWYPRMAVYDDVHGWNHEPYIGAGEFYLEYGDFDVTLTVPFSYIVCATGELTNPTAVLTSTEIARLALARKSDTTVHVITSLELSDFAVVRPVTEGVLTWHFTAHDTRDFAWAAGPDFLWDASGWDNILIETLYRRRADKWPEANRMARETIRYFSEQWYHYPYSHATTIEGPIQGMEYPMLTFVPNSPTREDQQWALAHEFGHEWFPMIVGSNERLYPWMDEGFNTFIDLHNAALYFKGTTYGDTIESHPLHLYAEHARPGAEQPIIENPTEVRDLFWTGYQKPALMMQTLRFEVLGQQRFDDAFRAYIRAWAFKHPTPADFFRVMRDASGMNLDWFWREWIYTTARLDQSVDSVVNTPRGARVYLANRGTMVMPLALTLTFADRTIVTVRLPVEMWNLGNVFVYRVPRDKAVVSAEIDAGQLLPDLDRANNVWRVRP
jgi:Peptidase family M1 domain